MRELNASANECRAENLLTAIWKLRMAYASRQVVLRSLRLSDADAQCVNAYLARDMPGATLVVDRTYQLTLWGVAIEPDHHVPPGQVVIGDLDGLAIGSDIAIATR